MSDTSRRPGLQDLRRSIVAEARGGISTAFDAVVEAYDRTTRRADVRPLVSSRIAAPNDAAAYLDLQPLLDVPVAQLTWGSNTLTCDLAVDQLVLVIVRDRSHDEVDAGNREAPVHPSATRRHNTSDAIVLPVYYDPIANDSAADAVVMRMGDGVQFRFGDSTAAKALAVAERVEAQLDAIESAFSGHTHAAGGLVAPPGGGAVTGVTASGPSYTAGDVASTRVFTDD